MIDESKFATKKEFFQHLVDNKKTLIAQKGAEMKRADAIHFNPVLVWDKNGVSSKEESGQMPMDKEKIEAVLVINTTNYLDSHNDLHIGGLWNKSLKENRNILHLQEHEMDFDCVISDGENLKAFTKQYNWAELGFPYEGSTEALIFKSTIEKKRNEFMFNQYLNGWVKQHSVGMRYVKYDMAINDEDYVNEYEAWKKYYPLIANKEVADERGYFWFVLEAKVIEGSAVVLGSNSATPTISVQSKQEPSDEDTLKDTNEPPVGTQKESDVFNYLSTNLKFN